MYHFVMDSDKIFNQMADAIVELDEQKVIQLAQKSITDKMNLLDVIEKGFGEGIRRVGDLWDEGELFLPELMRGAQIMQKAVDIITPVLQSEKSQREVGKTIVGTMLRANGFEVKDLGADVKAETIVNEAVQFNADVIGVSTLLTTTMLNQKKVIDILVEKKLRSTIKVILGGAPVTQRWIEECKADGYAENAVEAVKLVKSFYT